MPKRELIAQVTTPDGDPLTLSREDQGFVVRVRGEILMSSRQSGSEEAMAEVSIEACRQTNAPHILIGGLGMGFTVRAVLDRVGPAARVWVIELLNDVVVWNQGLLAGLADNPLNDARVQTRVDDLVNVLDAGENEFDQILLDIDNGPEAFTVRGNDRLYQPSGLAKLYAALRPGGVLVVWSAFRSDAFERRLTRAGFNAKTVSKRARTNVGKGARHTLFVAVKPIRG